MSNLTDFFPAASGGGDSVIVTNPLKLPRVASWANNCYSKYDNNNYASSTGQFWSNMQQFGSRNTISVSDVYTTTAEVTGSGYFYYSVSPCGYLNSTVTARFTIDGVVTEIPMTVNKFNTSYEGRAIIGAYTAGSSNSSTTIVGWNQFAGDYGQEDNRTNFSSTSSENYQTRYVGLYRPDAFQFPGIPKLRFETDFKLEYKSSAQHTTNYGQYSAAVYKLD